MTGEMGYSDLKEWPHFFRIARNINRATGFTTTVKPFDKYQGPFIAVSFMKKGKFMKNGRDVGSWNVSIWGTEHEKCYWIEKYGLCEEFRLARALRAIVAKLNAETELSKVIIENKVEDD